MGYQKVGPPYSSGAVANRLILSSLNDGRPIDPMQAQKLAYIANGRCWSEFETPLINERVKAWRYGPVFPSLYQELAVFENKPIKRPLFSAHGGDFAISAIPGADMQSLDLISRVWNSFGHLSGVQLSRLAHLPGSPWYEVRTAAGIKEEMNSDIEIPADLMKAYFKENFIC